VSARDDVLHRVRTALTGARATGPVPRDYRAQGDLAPGDPALLDLLEDRLVDYRAVVRRTDAAGLPAAVAAAVGDAAPGRVRLVIPPGLPPEWLADLAADIVVDGSPVDDSLDDEDVVDGSAGGGGGIVTVLDAHALDRLDGVMTACRVAIAETGTVVLDAGPDQGRRALTLVPDLHVCVVHAEQVVATVPEAVARLDPTRPLTWISGPSATSDIELVRVEGVHGPRRLQVVLVQETAGAGRTTATQETATEESRHS